MKVEFVSKKVELTESFQDFVENKLKKFKRYIDENAEIRVHLEELHSGHSVDIIIQDHGDILRAQSEGQDLREAFMEVVHKLDVQIEKKRNKLRNRKRRQAHKMESQWQMSIIRRGEGSSEDTGAEQEITTTRVDVKTLGINQAVTLLDKSGEDFIVFRDRGDGSVRLLHRRSDGHYNLIIPE